MRKLATIAVRPMLLKLTLWAGILSDFNELSRMANQPIPIRKAVEQ